MLGGATTRSFDDLLASFTYKVTADEKRGEIQGIRRPIPPDTPPPPPQFNSSSSSSRSSYIRATTIGGETVVLSKYFPLPPTTSDPVPIYKKKKISKQQQRRRRSTAEKRPPRCLEEEEAASNQKQKQQQEKKKKLKSGKSTQLTAAERKSDAYRRVSAYHTWEPPPSCHNLLQERHSFDPWRVLIICMLLNLTTGTQVRRVLPGLFLRYPNAEAAANVPEEEIEKVIKTLGLQKKRARMIKQFSREYLGDDWTHVTQLHGIGKYAADAYAIFCVGKPESVVPEDHKLVDYWKFVCGKDTEGRVNVLN